jgi:FkbM family methyltransferase
MILFLWQVAKLLRSRAPFPVSKTRRLLAYIKLKLGAGATASLWGYRMTADTRADLVKLYEEIFIAHSYWFNAVSSNPRIVDCGSNIGVAVLYFKLLHPGSSILCFEPGQKTYRLLQSNIETNRLANVTVVNRALHDREEKVALYTAADESASLTLSMKGGGVGVQETETVLLSAHLDGAVDFLKMDIEGNELPVIEELARANKLRVIRQMVIEYHHHLAGEDDRLGRLLGLLEEHGFGYQLSSDLRPPFRKKAYQNLLIYAYQK